ncbi:hypothetical protein ACH5RR_023744 [Cinchona calisaya]|uniref:Phytocyanin domain-containing protein n=1 Tax=Cinchona calisaya TaxID=153742 RepID=A0ABD2ZFD1_9GENT
MALIRVAILFLMVATPAVHAVQHTVGGNSGWNTNVNYTSWASGQTFAVGDTLVFTYSSNHGVDVINQNDYNNCNAGNALQSYTGGNTNINLTQVGSMYFLCPTPNHCQEGMKLAVNVQSGSPGASSPSGSTTPSPPSTTKSPPTGAAGIFGSINHLMLGFSLVLAALVGHI